MINEFGMLMRTITADVNNYIGSITADYGIKQGQVEYFLLISSLPGINQLTLAEYKQVGKAAVTKAVRTLEADGLIMRVPDQDDKRYYQCYITPKGEAIVQALTVIRTETEKRLFRGFSEVERETFLGFMKRLKSNANDLKR